MLGPKLKYSSAFYASTESNLESAEIAIERGDERAELTMGVMYRLGWGEPMHAMAGQFGK